MRRSRKRSIRNVAFSVGAGLILGLVFLLFRREQLTVSESLTAPATQVLELRQGTSETSSPTLEHPLMIEVQRQKTYPGSPLTTVQTLAAGSNYSQAVASYQSDGLTIYGLLTVPNGTPPAGGWPAIIFNHGYIPPEQYRTTERYEAYLAGFARQGFVVFKPDYRGHGDSEGQPQGAYYSDAYITDVMNALASVQQLTEVNPDRVGMWGHSLGGHLTLRAMVISSEVKAGVIWAGVVASHEDMMHNWRSSTPWQPSPQEQRARRPSRQALIDQFGTPEENEAFWQSISPIFFVSEIAGPVQIHHGTADGTVPWEFSQSLHDALAAADQSVEYYLYQGADHNLSGSAFTPAMNRSVEFFQTHL